MPLARPRPAEARAWPRDAACWFLLPALLSLAAFGRRLAVLEGAFINPDSAMRLVRLEAILGAQAPLHAVARDGSGLGTVLHWSHLLDGLLLLLAAPVAAVLGWQEALRAVAPAVGPLGMGALGAAAAWAVLPVAGRGRAWLAAAAVGVAPAIVPYGLPGVVHHHVLLAASACMAAGWALRLVLGAAGASGGVALGAWAGAGLWLSPETLPFGLMALGAAWLAWWLRPGCARLGGALAGAGSAMLLVTGLAWAVDPPAAGWIAAEPDRVSLMFVLLAAGAALCGVAARGVGRRLAPGPARAGAGALAAGLGAAWLAAYPVVLRGTDGLMTPEQARAMLHAVAEMQPVRTATEACEYLLASALGTLLIGVCAARRRSPFLAYAALCGAALVGLGALHVRFAAYPAAFGAALLPVAAARATAALSGAGEGARALARVGLAAAVLLLPRLGSLGALVGPAQAAPAPQAECGLDGVAALLAPHAGRVVLAEVNETPELLRRTGVLTVGSLYHRNPEAFMRLRAAWRSTDADRVPPAVEAAGVELVLACPRPGRSMMVADLPEDTLLDRLNAGRPPAWLAELGRDGAGGHVLYRVVR